MGINPLLVAVAAEAEVDAQCVIELHSFRMFARPPCQSTSVLRTFMDGTTALLSGCGRVRDQPGVRCQGQ